MKKQNKFSSLSHAELLIKQKVLLKQLVSFKVSMDPSVITESNNVDGLRKDVKSIQRQIALVNSQTQSALST